MVCPYRVAKHTDEWVDAKDHHHVNTNVEYEKCVGSECPLYYVPSFVSPTGCHRVDREIEKED